MIYTIMSFCSQVLMSTEITFTSNTITLIKQAIDAELQSVLVTE